MEAIRGESPIAEICRKDDIHQTQFYKWNNQFREAGKKLLSVDTNRETTTDEVVELHKENQRLNEMVADLILRYDSVKKAYPFGINEIWISVFVYPQRVSPNNQLLILH